MLRPSLRRVLYQLVEVEPAASPADRLDASQLDEAVEREVRLELSDGTALLASWVEQADPTEPRSRRADGPTTLVDMSHVDPWEGFVGQAVEITFADPDSQVLEVRAGERSIFLYSPEHGHWHLDLLSARASRPRPRS